MIYMRRTLDATLKTRCGQTGAHTTDHLFQIPQRVYVKAKKKIDVSGYMTNNFFNGR